MIYFLFWSLKKTVNRSVIAQLQHLTDFLSERILFLSKGWWFLCFVCIFSFISIIVLVTIMVKISSRKILLKKTKYIFMEGVTNKTKNGFRQLGLIGNSISTHSFSNCRHLLGGPSSVALWNCMFTNDESNHQNIIQLAKTLATEVNQLKKR